jgi:[ribosomal protein S18]-alanine N-acetyltransferase
MPYLIRPMRLEDVDEVGQVDRECFTTPWPSSAYRREIRENKLGRYIVLESNDGISPSRSSTVQVSADGDHGFRRTFSAWLKPLGLSSAAPTDVTRRSHIVGFGGLWLMLDEAHITTICVSTKLRGLGLGEWLMSHLMDIAREIGAQRVTLEVRVSNSVAQRMYRKFGFSTEGVRPRYYSDNQEDALIMWSEHLDSTDYLDRLEAIKTEVNARVKTVAVR